MLRNGWLEAMFQWSTLIIGKIDAHARNFQLKMFQQLVMHKFFKSLTVLQLICNYQDHRFRTLVLVDLTNASKLKIIMEHFFKGLTKNDSNHQWGEGNTRLNF